MRLRPVRMIHGAGRWTLVAAAGVVALLLLVAAVSLGAQIPGLRSLSPFADTTTIDYSALRQEFTPLGEHFIRQVLGPASGQDEGLLGALGLLRAGRHRVPPGGPEVVTHPFTNKDIEHAYPISEVPFTGRTNTTGESRQSTDPTDCAVTGGDVWYRYTAEKNVGLIASTDGTNYAAALGVFSGSPGDLHLVGCNSSTQGSAQVAFAAIAGGQYWFQITGLLGGGNLVFSLERQATTTLISSTRAGQEGNGTSFGPLVSADGRYVTFTSASTNLDPKHRCVCGRQAYIRDLATQRIELVSLSSAGALPNGESGATGISADGRFVAFESLASNLVPNDTNGWRDVFVRDRLKGVTERVSVNSKGEEAEPVAGESGNSANPKLSADGRFVIFSSAAGNLVPDERYPGVSEVYLRDRARGRTTMVSLSTTGEQANNDAYASAISPDRRYVLFDSYATNLAPGTGGATSTAIPVLRVYVRDLRTDTTTLACASSSGQPADGDCGNESMSADGRYVAFDSVASNLAPVGALSTDPSKQFSYTYVRDMVARKTEIDSVSSRGQPQGDPRQRTVPPNPVAVAGVVTQDERATAVSWDGRFVLFDSDAAGLVPGDNNQTTDVFVHDRLTGRTYRVSVASNGAEGNGKSHYAYGMSADGGVIAFASTATNFSVGARSGTDNIYVHV